MNKKDIKYYSAIAVILLITIIVELTKPKPIDWSFFLESAKKEPYGTYILFNNLKALFPNQKITVNKRTAYEYNKNNKKPKTFIYISDNFNADKLETETIFNFLEKGSTVFISAHYFSNAFSDTLGFSTDNSTFFDTTSNLNFYNKKLKRKKPYFFQKTAANYFFNSFDTTNINVLAFSKKDRPTFIKQNFGKGTLFINTTPEAFTNYALITEKNYEYAFKCFSYLPDKDIVWDEYYKPFRKLNKTELSVIFDNSRFRAAYILLLITTVIFVLFTIKRRQRIIPVIKPFKNRTVEFVETIGRVYYNSKNHKDIALKKYHYFKYFLFSKYNIKPEQEDENKYSYISEKTGVNEGLTKKVLLAYAKINKLEKISQEQLNFFNNCIEDFYDECK
ncbi:MAG: hypothetical protein L3J35_06225 [Bacteroidales bacterium]|nr:hypothetical protein [Bacteroidales bacterium]